MRIRTITSGSFDENTDMGKDRSAQGKHDQTGSNQRKNVRDILKLSHDSVSEITARFVNRSAAILKEKLTGIYLHGSAAMGCYQHSKSERDFLVVTSE